ncbi:hypothetical protein ACUTG2_17180, partial [Klebsiella aerogenes]
KACALPENLPCYRDTRPESDLFNKAGKTLLLSGKETFALAGTELLVEIELVTEQPLPRDLRGDVLLSEINLPEKSEHALFISARQKDQSRIWTSAFFLTR